MILYCFIYGLKPEISREMAILQPTFVSHTTGLAKLIETSQSLVGEFVDYPINDFNLEDKLIVHGPGIDRQASLINNVEKMVEPKRRRPKVAPSWMTDSLTI
ncbi:hypothetical protein Lal_00035445 [Lupinus albus]|nr:hypothetical protein Lal_00035445 [Lupinus albus]